MAVRSRAYAPPHLDDHGVLPPFRLDDDTGHEVTNDSLRGHVTIVNFIFTRCDTVCPITSAKMRTVQERTGDEPRRGARAEGEDDRPVHIG